MTWKLKNEPGYKAIQLSLAIIFNVVGAISAMVVAGKVIMELSAGSKARRKDDYRFAKEFLNDLGSKNLHPLAVERGFYAIAGTGDVKAKDIEFLLSLDEPQRRLKDYVLSRNIVELNEVNHKFEFRKKYRSAFSRRWRKIRGLASYFLFFVMAAAPFLVVGILRLPLENLLYVFFTLPIFGSVAVNALIGYVRIDCAEDLVKKQRRHTPLIHTDHLEIIAA